MVRGARGPTCTDAAGSETTCDLGRVLAMRVKYDAGVGQALAFATYSPAVGNATALAIGHFRRGERGWTLVRTIQGVYGEGPLDQSFEGGRASVTMRALMPGDARCCLTGTQRYSVDLTTGAVTAGPKMPSTPTPASGGRRFAPRPEGYEGATYLHNGSTVLIDERVGTIRYEEPRPGMRGVVRKGSLLFKGVFAETGTVSGTAYAFKAGCDPAPYAVTGTRKGADLVLRGLAPRRDPNGCAVTGSSASGHAVLRFHEYGDM